MKCSIRLLSGILLPLVVSTGAFAAITTVPTWDGQPQTTSQNWSFSMDDPTPAPDSGVMPYGSAGLVVYVSAPFGTGWQDPADEVSNTVKSGVSQDGAWDLGPNPGFIEITVPVASTPPTVGTAYFVEFLVYGVAYRQISQLPVLSMPGYSPALSYEQELLASDGPLGTWQHFSWQGQIENVGSDQLTFVLTADSLGSIVDEVRVYTNLVAVIPEPSSSLLIMAGGVVLLRRRRVLRTPG